MQIIVVLSMVFAIFIALFAVQNAEVVTINLLWYNVRLSQAVVILGSALIGVLIMLPFDIFRAVKHRLRSMELSGEVKKLREELEKCEAPTETVAEEQQADHKAPADDITDQMG